MRLALVLVAACGHSTTAPATTFLKGQLHVHSNHSGDGKTSPEDVARWYRDLGYDFIVMTDHNVVTSVDGGDMLVVPGVELTQNLETCDPPPEAGLHCLLHVNALFVTPPDEPKLRWTPVSAQRLALYLDALAATKQLGGIAQLDHPNFHWAADAALVAELVRRGGLTLFELANQGSDVNNDGDATHPSTEQLWDAVLAQGLHLFGTATDDAHAFADADALRARDENPDVAGRGWVMVRAARDAAAIRDALARGDFYASTGVTLRRVDRVGTALEVEAERDVELACIANGREVSRVRGRTIRCKIPDRGYARVDARDDAGHRAWVQPAW